MRRVIRAVTAAALFAAGSITAFVLAGPANADTQICEQYGSTTIGGRYVVMNNRWGTSAQQCINVTGAGFSVTSQHGPAEILRSQDPGVGPPRRGRRAGRRPRA